MSKIFLDPDQPLSTCSAARCTGCPVHERIHCHFGAKDLGRFLLFMLPPFLVGGVGIARVDSLLLIPWILTILIYFGLVEIRVMCSHCPHYAEPATSTLKCWANYGSPKLWKYRPGPMSLLEKSIFFAGLILILAFPVGALLISGQWGLLSLLALAVVIVSWYMATRMCNQCINFACPLNRVDATTRAQFFATNPRVAQAWKRN